MPNFTNRRTKNGQPTAAFGLWVNLTEEEYAVFRRLSAADGKRSPKQVMNDIIYDAIQDTIDGNKPAAVPPL